MESRRVILAVALSLMVLLTWNYFFPPVAPVATENRTAAGVNQSAAPQAAGTAVSAPEAGQQTVQFTPDRQGRRISVDTPLYHAVINTSGGILESFTLKAYKETIDPLSSNIDLVTEQSLRKAPLGLIWNASPTWAQGEWTAQGDDLVLAEGQSGGIQLTGVLGGVRIVRELSFTGGSYEVKEEVKVTNTSPAQLQGNLAFSVSSPSLTAENDRYNLTKIVYMAAGGLEEEDDQKDLKLGLESAGPVQWGGVASNYFLMALAPTSADMIVRGKLEDGIYRVTAADQLLLDPGITQLRTCSYYFGPKTERDLQSMPKNLKASISDGLGGRALQRHPRPVGPRPPQGLPDGVGQGGGILRRDADQPVLAAGQGRGVVAGLEDDDDAAGRVGGVDRLDHGGRRGRVADQEHALAGFGHAVAGAAHDLGGHLIPRHGGERPARGRSVRFVVEDEDVGARRLPVDVGEGVGALMLAHPLRDPHAHPDGRRQRFGLLAQERRADDGDIRVRIGRRHTSDHQAVLRHPEHPENRPLDSASHGVSPYCM